MQQTPKTTFMVPPILQKATIVLLIGAYLAQLVVMWPLYRYIDNWEINQLALVLFGAVIMPLVLFGIALCATRRKSPWLWRIFVSSFLVIMTLNLQSILSQIYPYLSFDSTALMYYVPMIIALIAFIIAIIFYRKSSPAVNGISVPFQKAYGLLATGMVAISTSLTLYHITMQFSTNQNLSAFLSSSLQMIFLPLILFIAGYSFYRGRSPWMSRVFGAILLATLGILLSAIVFVAARLVAPLFLAEAHYTYWPWIMYNLATIVIAFALYIGGLFYLRNKI